MRKDNKGASPEPFTIEEQLTILMAREFFWYFLENVYIRSFDGRTYKDDDGKEYPFGFGALHREWAVLVQYNPRICVMAPRAHLKSTVIGKAFAFWQMFRVTDGSLVDILYFSYKQKLAAEKVEELIREIRDNPYCRFWVDLKPSSLTTINCHVDFGQGVLGEGLMIAEGVMSATRGRHPKVTICDDILSDFANPLASADLIKINRIVRQSIMSLPANPDDPLVVIGTPQSYDDILYQLSNNSEWLWLTYPAIINEPDKIVQWPEKFTFERLMKYRRSKGRTAFEIEFQLQPIRTTDQFFSRQDIVDVTNNRIRVWNLTEEFPKGDLATYAGVDVGRYVHPSHVAVFLELPNGTLIEIYERFMDQLRYSTQVRLLNKIAEVFKISRGYYDSTFNALEDRGLNDVWRGKRFTRDLKANAAIQFEKRVDARKEDPGIILLNDPRQLNQITLVDKQLKAATTAEGHGDAFWSIALACQAAEDGPGIIDIGGSIKPTSVYSPSQAWVKQLGG